MKNKHKKLGFVPPVIDNTHWVLGGGAIPHDLLQPNSDWRDTRPEPEAQNLRGTETYDCTGFATLNTLEQLIYKKYGEKYNFSDRWLGIVAGTKEPGNDPHTVAEAIRKYGLIPESMLPFGDNINNIQEYYSFKGADEEACYAEGKKWLEKWDFRHEWVFNQNAPLDEKLNNMKVALKRSPLGVAVYAWSEKNGQGLYERLGSDTHWTDNDAFNGDSALVFDSYEPFSKELTPDFNFYYCKLYYIAKKPTPEETTIQNQTLLVLLKHSLLSFFAKFLSIFTSKTPIENPKTPPTATDPPELTNREKLHNEALKWLGKDASPDDEAPDRFSCMESVYKICKDAGIKIDIKNKLSTYWAYLYFRTSPDWEETKEPKEGSIILAPTGYGNKRNSNGDLVIPNGHIGIYGKNGKIMSTNSDSSFFEENYTDESFIERYVIKGGYLIKYYNPKG